MRNMFRTLLFIFKNVRLSCTFQTAKKQVPSKMFQQKQIATSWQILACQLRSRIPKNIWNYDRRCDWNCEKYYRSCCQSRVCCKKSNWDKYFWTFDRVCWKVDMSIISFQVAPFCCPMFQEICTVNNAKTNKYQPKEGRLWPFKLDD